MSPRRYVQGPGSLALAGKLLKNYGKRAIIFADKVVMELLREPLSRSLQDSGVDAYFELFNMECSWEEINRLSKITEELNVDMAVGAGGGKALDTAKAIGNKTHKTIILIPTIASTDAPTSAISVIYTEPYPGEFIELKFWPRNPDLILVDTKIIASAPARFLACGMGDALSHFFEGLAVMQSGKSNFVWLNYDPNVSEPLRSTRLGFELCKLIYEVLRENGVAGMESARNHVVTPSLELCVETICLMSGLAFENTGCAAAHGISEGLTLLENKMRPMQYHGELVAFGIIVQLVLENRPFHEIVDLMKWVHEIGLPINLKELGIEGISEEDLWRVSEKAVAPTSPIHNEPFEVNAEKVFSAIKVADSLGRKVALISPRIAYE
ncbi:MAG: glycerol dehydrogenase [Candidatus Bathyarchaeia archaeon]